MPQSCGLLVILERLAGWTGLVPSAGERDASRATPEDVQPGTDRALARDVAGWTGLEPAASGVTGRRSNQLNYHPEFIAD